MTAHPKYYSFVGLIAPQDRKAVYMGYSFLYGILGSLLGSNIGAFLYERILKPVIGRPEAGARARLFWLMFAALDVVAVFGLIMFNRAFGKDTPETRRGAAKVMTGVYAGILLLGVAFLVFAFSTQPPQYRTAVQSVIFLALGGGGLVMSLRRKPEAA